MMQATMPLVQNPLLEGVLPRRVAAWLVDALILTLIAGTLWVLLFLLGLLTLGLGFPLLGLLPVLPFAYHTLFLAGSWAATPGQTMMDLAACRDADLGRPTFVQAVLFTAGLYATLMFGVLWFAAALFTIRNRALHDLVSGLTIVRARALTGTAASMKLHVELPGGKLQG